MDLSEFSNYATGIVADTAITTCSEQEKSNRKRAREEDSSCCDETNFAAYDELTEWQEAEDESGDGGARHDDSFTNDQQTEWGDHNSTGSVARKPVGAATVVSEPIRQQRASAWEAKLRELEAFRAEKGHCRVPWGYSANPSLAGWCDSQRRQYKLRKEGKTSAMTDERERVLNEIGFWWGIGRLVSWEDRYEALKKILAETGICDVLHSQRNESPMKKALHQWIRHQRRQYHDGELNEQRRADLEAIGFSWGVKMPKWNDNYNQLVKYKQEHGDCNVSIEKGEHYEQLANWVDRQRATWTNRKNNKSDPITDERLELLEQIGFCFTSWDVKYSALVTFKKEHGHCNVPRNHPDKDLKNWVLLQRTHFRKWKDDKNAQTPYGKGGMTNDRLAALIKLGFIFETKINVDNNFLIERTKWNAKHNELIAYKQYFGNCEVPKNFAMNKDLAKWVLHQREEYKLKEEGQKSSLTDERINKLSKLGFSFTAEQVAWNEMFAKLLAYKEQYGDVDIPSSHAAKLSSLSQWIDRQRTQYKLKKQGQPCEITDERIERLSSIGFSWIPWSDSYQNLLAHKEANGDSMDSITCEALKDWFTQQRDCYQRKQEGKPSTMSEARLLKLNEIGVCW
eukprot:CAMPEP_0195513210 /NCGR_PEP_ID=MMETSP0794_2-20130614/4917_1 /TAXON_ID=515487 /ORGANISM="Stephanopyxis turris, Strain CCMP 815" /LENGTH=623 /DNA_ID=CAMNT_0040641161 /DNA_START=70 /DNA_END=1938 /DNA_ORIENTATION=-